MQAPGRHPPKARPESSQEEVTARIDKQPLRETSISLPAHMHDAIMANQAETQRILLKAVNWLLEECAKDVSLAGAIAVSMGYVLQDMHENPPA